MIRRGVMSIFISSFHPQKTGRQDLAPGIPINRNRLLRHYRACSLRRSW